MFGISDMLIVDRKRILDLKYDLFNTSLETS